MDTSTKQIPEKDEYREQLFNEFISALPDNLKSCEIREQLRFAYDFAYKAHYGVYRKCGNKIPYITHPVSVALIVANEIGLGVKSVVAALLHDVVEDTEYTYDDISEIFGKTVANIVDGLTKITNVYDAKSNAQADTFKKMLLSIPQDPRVSFIKIADRIHNMRTMEEMPEATRQIKAGENLYVYVPIADQFGLYDIKNELEDSSFKYAHPQNYTEVVAQVTEFTKQRAEAFANFKMQLLRTLLRTGFTTRFATVKKSYFQIWNAMRETGNTVDQIPEVETIRIIFDPHTGANKQDIISAHYLIYSHIISKFPERADSKSDYVINPKKNGFQALVFQVMSGGHWFEIQIITADNDQVAHYGYSEKRPNRIGLDELKNNLKSLTTDDEQDSLTLINRFRGLSMLNAIFVFTPKGEIKELPAGATVLDFAFAVRRQLGIHCLGAIVDQKIVPINHKLKTTDKCQVLTSPSVKPTPDWLNYVKSETAKTSLNKYLNRNPQTDNSEIIKGRQVFNKLLRDHRIIPTIALLGNILSNYKLPNTDEFYRLLARQALSTDDLLNYIKRLKLILGSNNPLHDNRKSTSQRKNSNLGEINYKQPITLTHELIYVLATCCNPINGDDAVCYSDADGILYVHRRDCVNAQKMIATNGKKTTKIIWGDDLQKMEVFIMLHGTDRQGLIKDLVTVLQQCNVDLQSLNISADDGIFGGTIQIKIKDLAELDNVIKNLLNVNGIVKASRTYAKVNG